MTVNSLKVEPIFLLFIKAWGILIPLHYIVYVTQFGASTYYSTYFLLALSPFLIFCKNPIFFYISVVASVIEAMLQAPSFSNHTVLKNFILLALLISFFVNFTSRRKEGFFELAAPACRALLCTMYVFGVFHKINSDFLFSDGSCAVALWMKMPSFLSRLEGDFFYRFIAFATLVIEFVILFFLLVDKFRTWGVLCGILFHGFLAISGYAFYPTFSTLTIALHLLFLDREVASKFLKIKYPVWIGGNSVALNVAALVFWFLIIWFLADLALYSYAGLVWFCGLMVFIYLLVPVINSGRNKGGHGIISNSLVVNLVPLVFFFNCFSPYLGLKTAQSMNMFANLRLEGGFSNHFIVPIEFQVFPYLKQVVVLKEVVNEPYLTSYLRENITVTYYDLINRLERNRHTRVSFSFEGQDFTLVGYDDLSTETQSILHPRWFRAFFHSYPVDLNQPKACALNR